MSESIFIAILATTLSLLYFLFLGYRTISRTQTNIGFFKASNSIERGGLSNTIAAAGISNAAVAIAYLQLTPKYGLLMLVALGANLATQVFTIYLVRYAKYDVSKFSTVGNLVYEFTNSSMLRLLAETITLLGLFAALLVEVIIGAFLFAYLFPALPYADYFGALVVMLIVLCYVTMGGLVATVESDGWQFRLILLGIFALTMTLPVLFYEPNYEMNSAISILGSAPTTEKVWWAATTVILSIFGPIGQLSVWQRLSATRDGERVSGMIWGIFKLGGIYFLLLICGMIVAYFGISVHDWGVIFSLMREFGGLFSDVMFPLLFVGLVAALISTADTNTLAMIYSRLAKDNQNQEEVNINRVQIFGWSILILISISLTFFAYKQIESPVTLLLIIFIFYGLHVLLAPIIICIILGRTELRSERLLTAAIITGLTLLLGFGFYGLKNGYLMYSFIGATSGFICLSLGSIFSFGNPNNSSKVVE